MKKEATSDVLHREHNDPSLRDMPLTLWNLPKLPFLALIRLYQMTLSKALGPGVCRFYPTCSHYGYQVIYKYGVIRGGLLATWRVLRCNPFNEGGLDPIPEKISNLKEFLGSFSNKSKINTNEE